MSIISGKGIDINYLNKPLTHMNYSQHYHNINIFQNRLNRSEFIKYSKNDDNFASALIL